MRAKSGQRVPRRAFGAGLATAVALGALAAGLALAAGSETKVKLGLDSASGGDTLAGTVKSEVEACVKGRSVKVTFEKKSKRAKQTLGKDKTNGKGKFSVPVPGDGPYDEVGSAERGTYTAKAKQAEADLQGATITCKGDKDVFKYDG